MKTKFPFTIAFISAVLLSGACFAAEPPADNSPEKAAVIANDKAYEAAYAKADVKAMVDFFAEDAEYTSEDGKVFTGRAEIEEAIRQGLLANRGAKLAIEVSSVRVLGPESVLEKGTTSVIGKDGSKDSSLYAVIHVKKDGKWKIAQLIESPIPAQTPRDRLSELEWLIGEWEDTDKSDDLSVRSQYAWARGGNFLARSVTVKRAGQVTLEGWEVIGWDPVEQSIRSWIFDGEGGFSEGRWTHDGNRWLQRQWGTTPDGSRTTADVTITKVGADKFTWEANNRTLDGDPQPNISRIEVNRAKGR
jgi:uncharacterized protein (TIGR02246 family)